MNGRPLTIRLSPETFAALATRALAESLRPSTLARQLVEKSLTQATAMSPLEALRGLALLRSQLPVVDAAEITREGRDVLSRRGSV